MSDVVKRVARKGRGRRRNAPMSEINVTPFVDVMLVLLIIFTLTAFFSTVTVARYSSSKLVQKQAQEAAGQAAPKKGESNDS